MNAHTDALKAALKKEMDALLPKSQGGDEEAHIKWAFGQALYEFINSGGQLTDLPWFRNTTHYTAPRIDGLKKAA